MKVEAARPLGTDAWALHFYHILLVKTSLRPALIQGMEKHTPALVGKSTTVMGQRIMGEIVAAIVEGNLPETS